MIIVSQDKTETTDNLNLRIEVIVEEQGEFPSIIRKPTGYCIVDKKYSTQLEIYKTEERAKEVLQGIIRVYEKAGNIAFETDEFKTDENETAFKITNNSNVFEMPED